MSTRRWAAAFAAWAVLFSGLTNAHAHVHLCLDGQEPPASVHIVDGSTHAHDHFEQTGDHDDLDLDVPNQALAKTVKYDLPAILPLTAWTLSFDSSPAAALAPEAQVEPHPPPLFSRPALRAPPL